MKKLVLTTAIVLGMVMGTYAQSLYQNKQATGGLFYRGNNETFLPADDNTPFLPAHNQLGNQDADTNSAAPLGSGALLLMGFGAAYALSKKNKKD